MTRLIPPEATRVRFSHPAREDRYWWRIATGGETCVACVRQSLNRPDGVLDYTLVDLKHGVRGHVHGFDPTGIPGTCRLEDCERMVGLFESFGCIALSQLDNVVRLRFGDFR